MTDITIILPLPSYSEAQDAAYVRTIESIKKLVDVTPTIIAVGDAASNNHLKTLLPTEWDTTLLNVKNTTLQYEVGKAVKEVKTDYFSVIELGDEYLPTWFTHVSKEIELNEPNSLYLPILEVVDADHLDVGAIAYANEPVWASSFSEELGYIDSECLDYYFQFVISTGVFNKKDFTNVGGVKCNIKAFYWYELLKRYCHNKLRVYVIPKANTHYINQEGSFQKQEMLLSDGEKNFWFTAAKDECVFKRDREKTYVEPQGSN